MKRGSSPIKLRFNRSKSGSTLFLRSVILLIGTAVLALCVFALPAGIMSDETGAYRPILIGMYLPAVPFFIALFYAFKLLHYIDKNKVFSEASIKALQAIKYSAFVISALYAAGMPYIFTVAEMDDAPGVVGIGFIFIFGSLVVGTAAGVFQRLLRNVVDIKSENDLTV
jgi:MFS family permease